jgi:hypothetical protein
MPADVAVESPDDPVECGCRQTRRLLWISGATLYSRVPLKKKAKGSRVKLAVYQFSAELTSTNATIKSLLALPNLIVGSDIVSLKLCSASLTVRTV